MATATSQVPPSNKILPGSRLLPTAPFPDINSIPSLLSTPEGSPQSIADDWAPSFNNVLSGKDTAISQLFFEEACWRDLLCMTWDFHTLQGPEQISKFIQSSPPNNRLVIVSVDSFLAYRCSQASDFGGLKAVRAFLTIETSTGKGKGLVRLVSDTNDGGKWKALSLFTTLEELKGHEEKIRCRRPRGTESDLEDKGLNWTDQRRAQQNLEGGRPPTVLILGML